LGWREHARRIVIVALFAMAMGPGRSIAAPPTFAIPAGDLADALTIFSQQSHQQMLFAPQAVRGKKSHRISGTMPADRALARLLRGTAMHAEHAPGGAVLIVADPPPVPKPMPRPAPVPALPPSAAIAPALDAADLQDVVIVGTPGGGGGRRDAAYAVTTIDQPAIERLAPAGTAEVLRLVPGLTIESSGGKNGANIFVRGYPSGGDAEYVTFQSEGVPFFPPATLSFLENSQLIRLDDTVRRVEAVRGGTGALFASGQPGVTINIVEREGGPRLEGETKIGLFSDGERRADAYLSGPLAPDTHFMVGGYYSSGDGVRSPGFDADRGGQISANLRHDFNGGSLLLFGRYLNDRSQWLLPIPVEQQGSHISDYPGFDANTGTLAGPDTRFGLLNDGSRYDLADGRGARIVNLGANVEARIADGVTLRDKASWLAGHADTTGLVSSNVPPESATAYAAALGGTLGSLRFVDNGAPASPDQAVVEAGIWRVSKQITAWVNDATIEWRAGANKATAGLYAAHYTSHDWWNIGNNLLLTAQPHARRLDLTLADGSIVTRQGFTSGSSFAVNAHYRGDDLAFYAVDELRLSAALRADAGIRHQHHSVDGMVENDAAAGPGGADGNVATLYDNTDMMLDGTYRPVRYRNGAWSWTAGLNYDISADLGAFARFSRGHSFPFFDNLRDGIGVAPEVDTIEGGLKFATQPLAFYATIFRNRFRGLATTVIAQSAPIASIGGARATGVELEGVLRPTAAISIAFSGSWLDARYHHFFTDDGVTDLTGNRVQRQPVWQWRLTPNWDFALAGHKASLHTTLSYMGDRWSDVQNEQLLPHFYKLDAGATLQFSRRLSIELIGDNLTNTIGLTEGNPRTVGAQGSGPIFARPILGRSAEISLRYGF
jgi:outer membrane receptor protein involved in Fe transport